MSSTRRIGSLLLAIASLLSALAVETAAQSRTLSGRPAVGVASALVVDVADPERTGRVKVRFPWLRDGKEEALAWARVSLPLGGNTIGSWMLPEVDDEVLVAFEHGDMARPVILGSLWNGAAPPPPGGTSDGLTSPNGLFSIRVTDAGIVIRGPNAVVHVTARQVLVDAEDMLVQSVGQTAIASGATTSINGALIRLNGSNCPPVARVGDLVRFGEFGQILTGSPTITGC